MKKLASLILMLAFSATAHAAETDEKPTTINLSGTWKFALDKPDLGLKAGPANWKFPDTIQLPGILTGQGFGEVPNFKTRWTGDGWRYPELFKEWQSDDNFKMPFFLTPPRQFVGPAWYQKEITIPTNWKDATSQLFLERVHWQSIAWIDEKKLTHCDSLGTPHTFNLGVLAPGKHILTLRIDNRLAPVNPGPLSHSVTDHTQGNWNGVVGKIELRPILKNLISHVKITPSTDGTVRLDIIGHLNGKLTATILGAASPISQSIIERNDALYGLTPPTSITLKIPKPILWDEFSPKLYTLKLELSQTGKTIHTYTTTFGIRQISNNKGTLTLNGHPIFLRGTLECAIFPKLGHPPTDVAAWKRIIRICKAHGLNHIRFHSWCPPEAAFTAADELGFYYQVEASSWANQGAQIGSARPLDAWIEAESTRMLTAYGNHPSFLLMAYGNEPSGENNAQWLSEWVTRRQNEDTRRIYTTAAGWPMKQGSDFFNSPGPRVQGWGQGLKSIINGQAPRTNFDWSSWVKKLSSAPIVSHEIGQWCVYPNFEEIKKYTGYFKAKNFEIFRETAKRNGILPQSHDFLHASGKLQTLAYKHDIEAALRTQKFGGFQLLDLHDVPGQGTALVGVLDAFWDSKGYVTAKEFHRFCGPVVPLARLPKMIYTTADELTADIQLAHFGPHDFKNLTPTWKLTNKKGKVVLFGKLPACDVKAYGLRNLGSLAIPLKNITAPAKLTLTISAKNQKFSNHWDIFVYPVTETSSLESATPPNITETSSLESALAALAQGKSVLWTPPRKQIANDPDRPIQMGFSPIFWNTAWTNWQPPHTLGILTDPAHPALTHFPTDSHSNWQWWEIMHGGQPFILTQHPKLKPIVQVIDDWVTNRKLGLVFEAKVGRGKLIACSADISNNLAKRPVARQLRSSLLSYIQSKAFTPKTTLTPQEIQSLTAKGSNSKP
jgi:hypothetical protein